MMKVSTFLFRSSQFLNSSQLNVFLANLTYYVPMFSVVEDFVKLFIEVIAAQNLFFSFQDIFYVFSLQLFPKSSSPTILVKLPRHLYMITL